MIRILDVILSSLAIVLLLPFMIPIMIGLKLTGEHDIFYRQMRIGMGGKPFGVWKFATMLRNSPNMPGGVLTQKNDPRILPMGKFLRKTKINELPQLINVFVGQMSFVGPRPQAVSHYDLYSEEVKAAIDTVRPGITGVGSLIFRDEEDMLNAVGDRNEFHDKIIAPYKGELEKWFVKNNTLWNYIKIIALTAWSVVVPSYRAAKSFKELPNMPDDLKCYIS